MNRMEEIFENAGIASWVKHFLHAPHQFNQPHEADAELIELPGDPDHYLAVTTDTLAEEIIMGLYRDPYTMGWVTVMACLSDLAAVGAKPLGLVVSISIESNRDEAFNNSIAQGMEDACRTLGIYILGGDTNLTPTISLTGCAFGLVPKKNVMTRCGFQPGDEVFITGNVGTGNALGMMRLTEIPEDIFPEKLYRPVANIKEGLILKKYVGCCMDTSDGLLTTIDQLMRINGFGFIIECNWEKILAPEVLELCNKTKTPPWFMIAGPHGEFELLFAISAKDKDKTTSQLKSEGINPIRIGRVQKTPVVSLALPSGRKVNIDMALVRNLLQTVEGDLDRYVREFKKLGKKWGIE